LLCSLTFEQKLKKYEHLNREQATSAHVVLKYTDKAQKFCGLKN
jgi:hypothetical protein